MYPSFINFFFSSFLLYVWFGLKSTKEKKKCISHEPSHYFSNTHVLVNFESIFALLPLILALARMCYNYFSMHNFNLKTNLWSFLSCLLVIQWSVGNLLKIIIAYCKLIFISFTFQNIFWVIKVNSYEVSNNEIDVVW